MTARVLLALMVGLASVASAQATADRSLYVIVHGAWGGSWDWRVMDSLLSARGQRATYILTVEPAPLSWRCS